MTDPVKFFETHEWMLLDGATGTNLFDMGLEAGDAPELWNTDFPDRIRALYQGWVDAGSDIFLTNSFGGTAARLKLHEAQGRVHELNFAAALRRLSLAERLQTNLTGMYWSRGPLGQLGKFWNLWVHLAWLKPRKCLKHRARLCWRVGSIFCGLKPFPALKSFRQQRMRSRDWRLLGAEP